MSMTTDNTCSLQLHQEKIADLRHDLAEIHDSAFKMGLNDAGKLMGMLTEIEKEIFECSLLQSSKDPPTTSTTSTTSDSYGVKLPKLDIPTFSGNVLEWQTFWEQFRVSVHDRPISDAEKLV